MNIVIVTPDGELYNEEVNSVITLYLEPYNVN